MEAIAVLTDDVGDLPLPIEHEECHVCRGGLSKAKVTCGDLLAFVQQGPHALRSSIVGDVGRGGYSGPCVDDQPL